MLYPRDGIPAKGLVKYPEMTARDWRLLFQHLRIKHSDEEIQDLRQVTPDELLRVVFPVRPTPAKGVWIEFDLTDYPDLYKKCESLYETYSAISHQSCQILMQIVKVGTPVQRVPSPLSTRWSQILNKLVSEKRRLFFYFDNTADAIYKELMDASVDSAIANDNYKKFTEKIDELDRKMESKLAQLRKFDVSAAKTDDMDNILDGINRLEKYVLSKFYQYKDQANKMAVEIMEKTTGSFLIPADIPEIEAEELDIEEYIKFMTDETKIKDKTRKYIVVRLYPASAAITHGNAQVVVHPLSHNRFLTTKIPDSNVVINLVNNIALNTLDTQWFGFYSQLFNYIVDYGNPICTVSIGLNKIKQCSLAQVPKFTDTGESVFMFPLQIISSKEGLDIGES